MSKSTMLMPNDIIYNIINCKLLTIENDSLKQHWWRLAFRPGALLFVLFYLKIHLKKGKKEIFLL